MHFDNNTLWLNLKNILIRHACLCGHQPSITAFVFETMFIDRGLCNSLVLSKRLVSFRVPAMAKPVNVGIILHIVPIILLNKDFFCVSISC
jgi:hypothetical protein